VIPLSGCSERGPDGGRVSGVRTRQPQTPATSLPRAFQAWVGAKSLGAATPAYSLGPTGGAFPYGVGL
jgi:hypothetical protein